MIDAHRQGAPIKQHPSTDMGTIWVSEECFSKRQTSQSGGAEQSRNPVEAVRTYLWKLSMSPKQVEVLSEVEICCRNDKVLNARRERCSSRSPGSQMPGMLRSGVSVIQCFVQTYKIVPERVCDECSKTIFRFTVAKLAMNCACAAEFV